MSEIGLTAPRPFKKALSAYERGDFARAEDHCLTTLNSHADYFDALHLLAVVRSRRERHAAALAAYDKALELRPNNAELLNNRAGALKELKRYDEALACYDEALALRHDYADAYNNRGAVLMELGRYEEALDSYANALILGPQNPSFLNNVGRALTRLERLDEALACYDKAISLRPEFVDALINRGVALKGLKRLDEALLCYEKALELHPGHVEALLNRGNVLIALKRCEDAVTSYDAILTLLPDHAAANLDRGVALTKLKRFDEAHESYERALSFGADPAHVSNNRCLTLMAADRFDEALACNDKALSLRPDYWEAYNSRGLLLAQMERFDEAMAGFRRALELHPDVETEWCLGCLSLLLGDFENGWTKYELRRKLGQAAWTKLEGPEWRGEPLEGKRLLLYAEQGFGDVIQFARFAAVAKSKGAKVILGVYGALAELACGFKGEPDVIRAGEALPPYDFHLPAMSMPFVLQLKETDIPGDCPYLQADLTRVETWAQRLSRATVRVGVAWQGSQWDPSRWIPLAAFASLSRVPGVKLISLQKSDGLDQLERLPPDMSIDTLGPDFDAGPDAFVDTAAVMMNLDLIVTCDTAIAHLAGALGRPVWIVLKHVPEWRWRLGRADTPWYPTARLFRRTKDGDWAEVLERIAAELARLVNEKTGASHMLRSSVETRSAIVTAPLSIGDLIDRITILEIKAGRVKDPEKLRHVHNELNCLNQIDCGPSARRQEVALLKHELMVVNETIWDAEEQIRVCEHNRDFGPSFVQLARSVYKTNDKRAALKRRINELCGSALIEVKEHPTY